MWPELCYRNVEQNGDNKMIALHPEYIIDDNEQKKAVIITFNEWKRILAEMEELDDIRAYDMAKADKDDEIIPFEQAIMEIQAENVV